MVDFFVELWNEFIGYFISGLAWLADHFTFAGDHRWALAIVALTLIVRTLLIPLAIKQIRSMREQQKLQPEVQKLRQKFRNDRQRMSQEMMALYQREGVNPMAMCFPMIAQMPIFIAMFWTIRPLAEDPDLVMPLLGLADLGDQAGQTVGGWLLLAIMGGVQFLTTRQLNPGQTEQQRRMQMMFPLVFVGISFFFPVALVLYWTTQTIFQFVQQMVMTRDMHPDGVLRAIVPWGAKNGQAKGKKKAKAVGKEIKKPQVTAPDPVPGSPNGANAATRRDLAEKRRRRRRKKRKRRR
jgi:YidC/Oxa1 family membrane protein insertase